MTLDTILDIEDVLISWLLIILVLLDVALLFVCCLIHCKRLCLSDVNKYTYLLTYLLDEFNSTPSRQVWYAFAQRIYESYNRAVFSIFYYAYTVSFTVYFLTPKCEAFTSVPQCIVAVNLVKMCQILCKIIVLTMFRDAYTDEQDKNCMPPATLGWAEA